MSKPTLIFASDHAGLLLRRHLLAWASAEGYSCTDLGTDSDASCDYPDYGAKAAEELAKHTDHIAILVCGSGIGISMAANRYSHVRCALTRQPLEAALARQHNNANAIAFGERLTTKTVAEKALHTFLNTEFEAGRHTARADKLGKLPN